MKRLLSMLLVFVLALATLAPVAYAEYGLEAFSNDQLRDLYDCVRQEMKNRGLKLQQDVTLREGKYIVGDDIMPGTYTLKCTETSGDTYGGLYSSLGDLYGGMDSALGGLMGSLGGMMSDIINTEVQIIGDYGTVLKSYELKAGESVQLTLSENTALKISEGTCILTAE
ncbi:MAG: hypothetical protein II885_01675 [Oscillospiraceae bacterium]|nr:hypothetical protein [Oscillospiraceae bacterium]